MSGRFENKTVLITGASGGIGWAAMRAFAAEGARLVAVSLPGDRLNAVVEEVRQMGVEAIAVPTDLTSEKDVEHMVKVAMDTFGSLHVAFNNAGIAVMNKRIHEISEEEWDRVSDVSLKGVFFCMKHQIPALIASGGGSIINTSSIGGMRATRGVGAYVASKHGLIGLTKAAALEYSGEGIRINAICPGTIETPMLGNILESEEMRNFVSERHPIGRWGQPEEVASTVMFLASDAASFITGAVLPIDGGVTAGS